MNQTHKGIFAYHILAFAIVAVWGTTFVCTKVLLGKGLSPEEIFFYRFLAAYLLMLAYSHKRLFARSVRDELLTALSGVFGGSLYFYTENTALGYTATTNIALILCITPLLTAGMLHLFNRNSREKKNNTAFLLGSLLAIAGVACVILNGHFKLRVSPKGDLLCLAAALCWSFYTVCIRKLNPRYDNLFITRKVFFYGLITILPLYFSVPHPLSRLTDPVVYGNLLYLGVVASLLCFFFWNRVLQKINPLQATNYLYFSPVITATAAYFVLHESITGIMIIGAGLIVGGVYLSGKTASKKPA
ncbi:MAG: DMT family transporter [Bacteroidales bacterium]|nr:DMT family transporter [Bacteroidales bacterium]